MPLPFPRTQAVVRLTPRVLRGEDVLGLGPCLVRLATELDQHKVKLDFRRVEFPTASGLGGLVALHKELRAADLRLALRNVGESAYEVFAVTGLTGVLNVRSAVPRP
jgi:anti-anti-sigma regulatory factor